MALQATRVPAHNNTGFPQESAVASGVFGEQTAQPYGEIGVRRIGAQQRATDTRCDAVLTRSRLLRIGVDRVGIEPGIELTTSSMPLLCSEGASDDKELKRLARTSTIMPIAGGVAQNLRQEPIVTRGCAAQSRLTPLQAPDTLCNGFPNS